MSKQGSGLLALCFWLCWAGAASGQAYLPPHPHWSPQSWMMQPWTGDDKPYRLIREAIQKAIAQGKPPEALVQQYRTKARNNPSSPEAQFAWAYATHELFITHHNGPPDFLALKALSETGVENVYEYTRLRFLLTQEAVPNANQTGLKTLGERLLSKNPEDHIVRTNLIYALSSSRESLPDALRLAEAWVKRYPNKSVPHAALAAVNQTIWNFSQRKNRAAIDKAIAEYYEYLRLAPANHYYRKRATVLIKVLQDEASKSD